MGEPSSIVVKRIPGELTTQNQEELLKLFGATKVRCVAKRGKTTKIAYATFNTHEEAKHALTKLHQLSILNHHLLVEFCREEDKRHLPNESDFSGVKNAQSECPKITRVSQAEQLKTETEEFARKIHGLCPALGLDYIPSPLLKYKYPPPTPSIIANISHALVSYPKFYTQVLHLMNKMNLPAPFGPITPAPPFYVDDTNEINYEGNDYPNNDIHEVEEMDTGTEDESEIESEEDTANSRIHATIPVKPVQKTKVKKQRKETKYFLVPSNAEPKTVDLRTEPSEVFESQKIIESSASKRIQFNIKPSLEPKDQKVPGNTNVGSGFGIIQAPRQDRDTDSDSDKSGSNFPENPKFISYNELKQKRISTSEMRTSSAFRNYSSGEPTVRLYIKNLARQVEEKDLRYIFGRYINWDSETEKNMFDIRLMTEGRMKGQAFVTLPSEKQAIDAVRETNGFVLHTKPLVVQFARSAKPKETPTKPQEKAR